MQEDFAPPCGDFQTPYFDLEQGWDALVFADEQFVYVLTGNWEKEENYTTWFKVEKDCYDDQWQQALKAYRAKHTDVVTNIDPETV